MSGSVGGALSAHELGIARSTGAKREERSFRWRSEGMRITAAIPENHEKWLACCAEKGSLGTARMGKSLLPEALHPQHGLSQPLGGLWLFRGVGGRALYGCGPAGGINTKPLPVSRNGLASSMLQLQELFNWSRVEAGSIAKAGWRWIGFILAVLNFFTQLPDF